MPMKKCSFCRRRLTRKWPFWSHPNCARRAKAIIRSMARLLEILEIPVVPIEWPSLEGPTHYSPER